MSSRLKHRGYEGTVRYSAEDKCLHGRLLVAKDVISYGGADLTELEKNFNEAVDEYLAFCQEIGKTPDVAAPERKAVRLPKRIHSEAARFARDHQRKLDAVVKDALEEYMLKSA